MKKYLFALFIASLISCGPPRNRNIDPINHLPIPELITETATYKVYRVYSRQTICYVLTDSAGKPISVSIR